MYQVACIDPHKAQFAKVCRFQQPQNSFRVRGAFRVICAVLLYPAAVAFLADALLMPKVINGHQ